MLYDCCRAAVVELLDAHVDFDVVERTIDSYALDRDEKHALWLWASATRQADGERSASRSLAGSHAH